MAFVADALLLFDCRHRLARRLGAARESARTAVARASSAELVDRADEMTLGTVLPSLYRYRGLLKALVLKDLKLKYRGSVFGFLWSLANPLLMIVVYTVAFTFILGIRSEMFVFYLMLGPACLDVLRRLRHDVDRVDRRQRRPAEDGAVSARHPADRHGALQLRAVPPDHRRLSSGDARLVPGFRSSRR